MSEETKQRKSYLVELVSSRNNARKVAMFCLIIAIISTVLSVIIYGRESIKVVIIGPDGRPYMTKAYNGSSHTGVEIEEFIKMATSDILTVSYADLIEKSRFKSYLEKVKPFFSQSYYHQFVDIFKHSYYIKDIYVKKSIVKVSFPQSVNIKKFSEGYIGLVNINVSSYYMTVNKLNETVPNVENQEKIYELRFKEGIRTVKNPYGLYIVLFTER